MEIIKKNSLRENVIDIVKSIIIVAIIVLPIRFYVAQPFVVNGESMFPTFKNGQYLIVDQISYKLNNPQRGDVIIFKFPQEPSKFFIKRVIALPGEKIKISNQKVEITPPNSSESFVLNEPYIELNREVYKEITLKDDEYFVMGDNRLQSYDSRFWGPLQQKYLIGKPFVRLFPFNEIGLSPGQVKY
jgi:signal peptidase I